MESVEGLHPLLLRIKNACLPDYDYSTGIVTAQYISN